MTDPTDINTLLGDVVQHREVPPKQIHHPYTWIAPNTEYRNAIVLTEKDKYKFLYQIDTQETMMVNNQLHWTSITNKDDLNKFSIAMAIVFGGNNV